MSVFTYLFFRTPIHAPLAQQSIRTLSGAQDELEVDAYSTRAAEIVAGELHEENSWWEKVEGSLAGDFGVSRG